MNETVLITIAIIVVVALLLLLLLRGRKQHVDLAAPTVAPARTAKMTPNVTAAPQEGHGVGSEVTAAIEDVIDQFVGIDTHPSGNEVGPGPGDALTTLKGLGPKASSRLAELGVTRFAQIASWDDGDIAAIDAQMGAFKGRIVRDRWVDQARLLANDDVAAFEEQFGKLGG